MAYYRLSKEIVSFRKIVLNLLGVVIQFLWVIKLINEIPFMKGYKYICKQVTVPLVEAFGVLHLLTDQVTILQPKGLPGFQGSAEEHYTSLSN